MSAHGFEPVQTFFRQGRRVVNFSRFCADVFYERLLTCAWLPVCHCIIVEADIELQLVLLIWGPISKPVQKFNQYFPFQTRASSFHTCWGRSVTLWQTILVRLTFLQFVEDNQTIGYFFSWLRIAIYQQTLFSQD